MLMAPTYHVFYGTFIHFPRGGRLVEGEDANKDANHAVLCRDNGAVWVSTSDGRIRGAEWGVKGPDGLRALMEKMGWVEEDDKSNGKDTIKVFMANEEENEFFFPGFIDTHIHASQYPNTGLFGSSTLLNWLETYTFPLESSYTSLDKAHQAYTTLVSRTLSHGTTCAAYFATIHVPATNKLADICHTKGQRALIGRVCMDNPSFCPEYYRDAPSTDDDEKTNSVSATKETISHIRNSLDPTGSLIRPIITPRFALTCTQPVLSALAHLATSHNPPLPIQTHISENRDEVDLVRRTFPHCSSYADIYDRSGLLTPRTILAHGVHLSRGERALIRTRGSGISHCPASNTALGSGVCPVRVLLDEGIHVGLGTDVSGGFSVSVLDAVRGACLVSRLRGFVDGGGNGSGDADDYDEEGKKKETDAGREKLSVEESLYLATRGGAEVVDMEGGIGGFEEGMFFDAQKIRLGRAGAPVGNVDVFGWESWQEMVHKWVWTGDDRNVGAVWVNGKMVVEKS